MDLNDFRSFHTVLMLFIFVGIWIWAWSNKRRHDFDEASHLPLNEPEFPVSEGLSEGVNNKVEGDTP